MGTTASATKPRIAVTRSIAGAGASCFPISRRVRGVAAKLLAHGPVVGLRVERAGKVQNWRNDHSFMKLEQIDHIALRCASIEITKAWYINTLGFEHVFQGLWSGVPTVLRLGSTLITLFPQKENPAVSGTSPAWHMGLRAATYTDFRSAQAELQAQGIPFQFRDHEISHSIYFTDPDGFLLEITTYDLATSESETKASDQPGN